MGILLRKHLHRISLLYLLMMNVLGHQFNEASIHFLLESIVIFCLVCFYHLLPLYKISVLRTVIHLLWQNRSCPRREPPKLRCRGTRLWLILHLSASKTCNTRGISQIISHSDSYCLMWRCSVVTLLILFPIDWWLFPNQFWFLLKHDIIERAWNTVQ